MKLRCCLMERETPDRARAEAIIEAVRQSGRTLLTETESKELLACYQIPTAPTLEAHSAEEAVAKADEFWAIPWSSNCSRIPSRTKLKSAA